jgi:hypothetical protein
MSDSGEGLRRLLSYGLGFVGEHLDEGEDQYFGVDADVLAD